MLAKSVMTHKFKTMLKLITGLVFHFVFYFVTVKLITGLVFDFVFYFVTV